MPTHVSEEDSSSFDGLFTESIGRPHVGQICNGHPIDSAIWKARETGTCKLFEDLSINGVSPVLGDNEVISGGLLANDDVRHAGPIAAIADVCVPVDMYVEVAPPAVAENPEIVLIAPFH